MCPLPKESLNPRSYSQIYQSPFGRLPLLSSPGWSLWFFSLCPNYFLSPWLPVNSPWFSHTPAEWLFPSPPGRLLMITLQRITSRFNCWAEFCLYWSAFHSQFSLGQTKKAMHLKQNKMSFLGEKKLSSRPLAKLIHTLLLLSPDYATLINY